MVNVCFYYTLWYYYNIQLLYRRYKNGIISLFNPHQIFIIGGGIINIKYYFKNHSIFISWVMSYLLVLLVLIAINAAVYVQTQSIIKNEINRTSKGMLKQIQLSMDIGLNDVDTLVYQISMNTNFMRFCSLNDNYIHRNVLGGKEYDELSRIVDDLSKYKITNGYVIGMYIYLQNSDMILSASGLYDLNIFYDVYKNDPNFYESMGYEEWHEYLKKKHSRNWLKEENSNLSLYPNSSVVKLFRSLPLTAANKSDSTIVLILNTQTFNNALKNITATNNGWSMILDNKNQELFSSKPTVNKWHLNYDALTGEEGIIYDNIDGNKVAILYIKSSTSNWKYISILPYNIYQEKLEYSRKFIAAGIILSIVIGILLAYYLSRRNYYPVNELVNIIENKLTSFKNSKQNEFHLIKEAMNSTLDENQKIRKSLRQLDKVLMSNFLQKLLKGRFGNDDYIKNAILSYNINFVSEYFAVILFNITDFSELFKDEKNNDLEENQKLVHFIMSNIIEELASQNNTGYMVEIDEMLACLVNFRTEGFSSGKDDMLRVISESRSFITDKYNIHFKAAVSSIHKSVFGIPEAYKEALDVMEYETLMENDIVMVYEDIIHYGHNYHYSIENEYQLINFIKSGDVGSATYVLNDVFEKNIAGTSLSIAVVRCLMFDLASTVLKALNEIDTDNSDSFLDAMEFPNKLLSCEKISEMRQYMILVLNEVCIYVQQNKNTKKHNFIEDVLLYINQNFTDMNLSVSSISERFKLTSSYLIKVFKESTGKGVLEYINSCRIEKAKKLLKESDYNVKTIASKVGYYSINAFNRMFKKSEGITPGMYKDNISS
jgi:two-component system, response regulator YesN